MLNHVSMALFAHAFAGRLCSTTPYRVLEQICLAAEAGNTALVDILLENYDRKETPLNKLRDEIMEWVIGRMEFERKEAAGPSSADSRADQVTLRIFQLGHREPGKKDLNSAGKIMWRTIGNDRWAIGEPSDFVGIKGIVEWASLPRAK